jgi:succinoglycan biosynthesis protein ExoM
MSMPPESPDPSLDSLGDPRTLTLAVLTYRRPVDLAEILPLLSAQAAANATGELSIRVLVTDNDPDGGARRAVEAFAASSEIVVDYANETTPGISAARNRALASSTESDLLVFIDDDERPSPEWLKLLLATWRASRPAAVVGPVISTFEIEPEPWITAGRFFVRRRLPTGTEVDVAATNNLLLDLRLVRRWGIQFDLAFGISGGDDTMFTRQLRQAGGRMVWCNEAIVMDVVPRHRITRRWVVLRALSSGNTWSITSVKLASGAGARLVTRLRLTAKGGIRLLGGVARFVVGVLTNRMGQRARGMRTMARGVGMVGGAWGYKYLEYRRPTK